VTILGVFSLTQFSKNLWHWNILNRYNARRDTKLPVAVFHSCSWRVTALAFTNIALVAHVSVARWVFADVWWAMKAETLADEKIVTMLVKYEELLASEWTNWKVFFWFEFRNSRAFSRTIRDKACPVYPWCSALAGVQTIGVNYCSPSHDDWYHSVAQGAG